MAAKRIRCACGKIYDAGSLALCPDCQTPSPFSAAAEEAPKAGVPPTLPPEKMVMLDSDRVKRPWLYFREEHPFLAALLDHKKAILSGGVVALVVGGWMLRPRPKPIPTPAEHKIAAEKEIPATANSTADVPIAPIAPIAPGTPAPVDIAKLEAIAPPDLAAEIARAKPGATIKLASGTYRSGFKIDQPLHLIGDPTGGPVVIQCDNTGSLEINSVGVTLENLRFTGEPGGDFALVKVLDKAVLDLRNCMFATVGKFGVGAVATAKFSADHCTFSAGSGGTGVQLENDSRAELTDCLFKNNRWACTIRHTAQCKIVHCQFEQNGLPDRAGYCVGATGAKTVTVAEKCTFTANTGGAVANEGSRILLKGCTFKNNGVTDEPGHVAYGTVNANSGGQLLINDCTFDSNKQGLIVQSGGSAKLENCNFTNTGLRTGRKELLFYCDTISAEQEGSQISLFKTNIRGALQSGLNVVEGAVLKMEDCEVSGGLGTGLAVGIGGKLHSEATVVKCRFLNQKYSGVTITPDSVVKISGSTISGNRENGILLSGDQATVVAEECDISNNGACGIFALQSAFAVITQCTISGNLYGAQTGRAKVKEGAGLFLKNCKVTNSRSFGAGSFENGTRHTDDCSFTKNKKDFYNGGGLIIQNWSGDKAESEKKAGRSSTGQTGGMTGMEATPETSPSNDGEAKTDNGDSPRQKEKSPPPKRRPSPTPRPRKPTHPDLPRKAEDVIKEIRRRLPF